MNIEEALEILKRIYVTEFNTSSIYDNVPNVNLAIETLLTAYEKEKGENVKLRLQDIPLMEGELKAYKDRVNELKQEVEKEKEERERIGKLYYEANENCIKYEKMIKKQQKEIEELKNADLTTVYLNGVYDGEKKVEDKIKAKIEECEKEKNIIPSEMDFEAFYRIKDLKNVEIGVLQPLLEKE